MAHSLSAKLAPILVPLLNICFDKNILFFINSQVLIKLYNPNRKFLTFISYGVFPKRHH